MIKNVKKLYFIAVLIIDLPLGIIMPLARTQVQAVTNPANQELLRAAFSGDLAAVEAALNSRANVNYVNYIDSDEDTALMGAATYGHTEIVRMLIEHDADINYTDNNGRTALAKAAENRHVDIVNLLLKADADGNKKVVRLLKAACCGIPMVVVLVHAIGHVPEIIEIVNKLRASYFYCAA
jgi:ankyrin repeat protein